MKNKAINALIEMGMPADIRGFYYISDAMSLIEGFDYAVYNEWKSAGNVFLRLSQEG